MGLASHGLAAQEPIPPTEAPWNAYQSEQLDLLFGAGVLLDVGSYTQNDDSRELFGDHEELERGEIRAVRAFLGGTVRLPHPVGFTVGGAYRAFDQGFESTTDEVWTWFDVNLFTAVGPLGTLRLGKMKEPISLEREMSLAQGALMERPMHLDAFLPSRNVGLRLDRTHLDGRLTWAVGVFNAFLDLDDVDFNEASNQVIGRVSGLPIYRPDDEEYLHLGLGLRYSDAGLGLVRFRSSPEVFPLPKYVDTGEVEADGARWVSLEAGWGRGPVWLASEFTHVAVDGVDEGSPVFRGGHATLTWALTGEHRPYRLGRGIVGPAIPAHPVGDGWGLVELAVRGSWVDLSDGEVDGGESVRGSLGVNWYPTPASRVTVSGGLVQTERAGRTAQTGVVQARWQLLMGP
jgi:phosphate-selective porin OprO/OprP